MFIFFSGVVRSKVFFPSSQFFSFSTWWKMVDRFNQNKYSQNTCISIFSTPLILIIYSYKHVYVMYMPYTCETSLSLTARLCLSLSYSISHRANKVDIDFQNSPAPSDFKMHTPFNLFSLSGIVGGMPD